MKIVAYLYNIMLKKKRKKRNKNDANQTHNAKNLHWLEFRRLTSMSNECKDNGISKTWYLCHRYGIIKTLHRHLKQNEAFKLCSYLNSHHLQASPELC